MTSPVFYATQQQTVIIQHKITIFYWISLAKPVDACFYAVDARVDAVDAKVYAVDATVLFIVRAKQARYSMFLIQTKKNHYNYLAVWLLHKIIIIGFNFNLRFLLSTLFVLIFFLSISLFNVNKQSE